MAFALARGRARGAEGLVRGLLAAGIMLAPQLGYGAFVLLLSPFAPHIAEELWQLLGHEKTLAYEPWPEADPALVKDDMVEVPVQVNGKLRSRVTVPADADSPVTEAAARNDAKIAETLEGKSIVKVVVIPGKLVNFVVK